MCGRFASTLPPEFLETLFATAGEIPAVPPSWNITPGQEARVLRRHAESGERRIDALFWGLVPHFTKRLTGAPRPINARGETVAAAPLFRGAFARRRCLVPADLFYEWQVLPEGRQPYAVARADGEPLVLGGVWESWRMPDGGIHRSFAIVTTEASADIARLHERMPLVLEPSDWPLWLGEMAGDPALLLRPAPAGTLRAWPVSNRVNNARNNDASLATPATSAAIDSTETAPPDGPALPLFRNPL
ncbi:MAG TPA: SOS response-associated peptidase [Acidisoma sp.]|jgi:putative SOS response-associated peptidase YedK|uniref:SOS response-associated peptidase n=1 Tax=Acidisoma sp. TaxID=1872115 RepID=UPI002C592C91|nr:SOS response-associated peptidase [Acidisoma sp.]HTI03179.1 SOS response-associated peptidase [Acidisoma sp.]